LSGKNTGGGKPAKEINWGGTQSDELALGRLWGSQQEIEERPRTTGSKAKDQDTREA